MLPHFRFGLGSVLKSAAVATLAGVLGALAAWFVLVHVSGYQADTAYSATTGASSPTPGLDIVDRMTCRRWQRRIILVDGAEDGFARGGNEPARIDPRLLDSGYYKDLSEGKNRAVVLRNYDEPGVDKYFVDWFDLPRGSESVRLVLRTLGEPGSDNDNVRLGDLREDPAGQTRFGTTEFGGRLATSGERRPLSDGSTLLTIDLALLTNGHAPISTTRFIDWANSSTRPDQLEIAIGDDTRVDFMALVLCMAPEEHRGVTIRQFHNDSIGNGLSWLRCNGDFSQSACDPFSGDLSCKAELPLGCFKPGDRQPDVDRLKRLQMPIDSFSGGEVRMTVPIAGEKFPTLASANAYCRTQFGAGWHVLSYHEGGGGGIITHSRIPPKSRMWIDIEDQPHANCWDRDRVAPR